MLLSTQRSELCLHHGLLMWMLSLREARHLHLPCLQLTLCLIFLNNSWKQIFDTKNRAFHFQRQTDSLEFFSHTWNHPFLGLVAYAEHGFSGIPADPPEQSSPWNPILCPCLQLPVQQGLDVRHRHLESLLAEKRRLYWRPKRFSDKSSTFQLCLCLSGSEAPSPTHSTYLWCIVLRKTMVGVRGFVCQVVPIFRTKPQRQMEQQGAALEKGRCALKPTPLTSHRSTRTRRVTSTLPREPWTAFSPRAHT